MKALYDILTHDQINCEMKRLLGADYENKECKIEHIVLRNCVTQKFTPVVAGPWIGEFGVMLIRWIPFLRHLKKMHNDIYLIAGGYARYFFLYSDFIDEYWVLPESYTKCFLNIETSFNYGVLHMAFGNTGFCEHAKRKGLKNTEDINSIISGNWLKKTIARFDNKNIGIITNLEEGRNFHQYIAGENAKITVKKLMKQKDVIIGADRLLMLLPRLRKLQGHRSWSASFYASLVESIRNTCPKYSIVILGSMDHEEELAGMWAYEDKIINLISKDYDIEHQAAFWELSDIAVGPPSGGLVLAYIMGVPLLHIYKPNEFPTRKGERWDIIAEPDYTAVCGIKSNWLEVEDSRSGVDNLTKYLKETDNKI